MKKSRRLFLQSAAAGGAGLILPRLGAAQQGKGRGGPGGPGGGQGNGPGPNAGPGNSPGRPVAVDPKNPAIVFHRDLCEDCDHCEKSCGSTMGVMTRVDSLAPRNPICLHCGQCSALCPHDAITERFQYPTVRRLIDDPDRITVALVAPSIRVSCGELFGGEQGENVEGKTVAALKALGFDYVFDVTFGADMTIMEEAAELVRRLEEKEAGPMFTSCCPAWVKLAEYWFPEFLPKLSSSKSPILMQGAVVKTWFAREMKIDPAKLAVVDVAPCTAKKFEISRPEMNAAGRFWSKPEIRDVDISLTNRELGRMISEAGIDFASLPDAPFDSAMGRSSGAALLFGKTGGVMEAALRTAYYLVTKQNPPAELLHFEPIRGLDAVRETDVTIGDMTLKVAAVHGGANIFALMEKIRSGEVRYDFVEVMACPGGCVGGGGQPKVHGRTAFQAVRTNRGAGLTAMADAASETESSSYENGALMALYDDFLNKTDDSGRTIGRRLLQTAYQSRAADLE